MRSCIVAIAKYEKDYIKEWVDYNLNLGFNHIFIGDNNDDNTENLFEVLKDYIFEGNVTLIDIKSYYFQQDLFYKYAYNNLVGSFDWVLFYDIDEFLFLDNFSYVNDYLSQQKFDNFDVIKINLKTMTNNGYVIQIDKPVLERFTEESKTYNYIINNNTDEDGIDHPIKVNDSVKSFYRTYKNLIPKVHCTETYYDNIKYCDCEGNEIIDKSYWPNWSQYTENINFNGAHIKHYITKSLEEFVKYKIKRGWSCFKTKEKNEYTKNNFLNLDVFEKINGKSKLYDILFKEFCIKYNIK